MTALRHGIPDRVPYMELIVDEAFGLRLLDARRLAPPHVSRLSRSYFSEDMHEPKAADAPDDGFCMSIQPQIYFKPGTEGRRTTGVDQAAG
jgi:hypothetical protein